MAGAAARLSLLKLRAQLPGRPAAAEHDGYAVERIARGRLRVRGCARVWCRTWAIASEPVCALYLEYGGDLWRDPRVCVKLRTVVCCL